MAKRPLRFRIIESEDGTMLGNLLARRVPDLPLERAREIVRAGGVYVGNNRMRIPAIRVAAGERVTVYLEAADVEPLNPDELRIVHHDEYCVVVDKPPGVPVSATRESARGTLCDGLVRWLEQKGVDRPYVGVVHRLDRPASGLVLLTVRGVDNRSFHRQFTTHRIDRIYRLVVLGESPPSWDCDVPLLESRSGVVRPARSGEPSAKPATTRFRRLLTRTGPEGPESLVEAELVTGRTHQIRVHAATSGFPIRGDGKYGSASASDRLLLHAWRMEFAHPISGAPIRVAGALPDWATAD